MNPRKRQEVYIQEKMSGEERNKGERARGWRGRGLLSWRPGAAWGWGARGGQRWLQHSALREGSSSRRRREQRLGWRPSRRGGCGKGQQADQSQKVSTAAGGASADAHATENA